jgi:hypothetical protein
METGEETIFPCKENLYRNETNFRAEKTFQVQLEDSDNESKFIKITAAFECGCPYVLLRSSCNAVI